VDDECVRCALGDDGQRKQRPRSGRTSFWQERARLTLLSCLSSPNHSGARPGEGRTLWQSLEPRRAARRWRPDAVTTPRVSSRPTASQSVPHLGPPTAVPHQAKRRQRPVFSLFLAVLAMAPPARIELATLALGKPCSIQLSYGGGRRRLSRPSATLKLCRGFPGIFRLGSGRGRRAGAYTPRGRWPPVRAERRGVPETINSSLTVAFRFLEQQRWLVEVRQPSRVTNYLTKFESQRNRRRKLRRNSHSKFALENAARSARFCKNSADQAWSAHHQRGRRNPTKRIASQRKSVMVIASRRAYSRAQELVSSRLNHWGLPARRASHRGAHQCRARRSEPRAEHVRKWDLN
jgi:hypothetical protein